MAIEPENNFRLEIGHVLFIDLVGYSKLLIEEQKERLSRLTEIVLVTSQVAKSTNEQLVRLPTGDGMALVFRNSSEEPARCALEIAQALKAHREITVRMGVHSGAVSEVTDVSGRTNIAGAGINMAQRAMDCGDAFHILLSRRVAADLEQYRQWQPRLHALGECEAMETLNELNQLASRRIVSPYHQALVYLGLGENSHPIDWLEKAYGKWSPWLAWLKVEPMFDPLRSDPRFHALHKKMNIPP